MAPTCRIRRCSSPLALEPTRVNLCWGHKCLRTNCPDERNDLEGGDYCRAHECWDRKCVNASTDDDYLYCKEHRDNRCMYEYGCDEHLDVTISTRRYCPDHTCAFEAPQCFDSKPDDESSDYCDLHTCKSPDGCCDGVTNEVGSRFCYLHECRTRGCQTYKEADSDKCADHGCASWSCDRHVREIGLEYCAHHGCHFEFTMEGIASPVSSSASSDNDDDDDDDPADTRSFRSASYSSDGEQERYCDNPNVEHERYCDHHICKRCRKDRIYWETADYCKFCACPTVGCAGFRLLKYCEGCTCNLSTCNELAALRNGYEWCSEHYMS